MITLLLPAWLGLALVALRWPGAGVALALLLGRTGLPDPESGPLYLAFIPAAASLYALVTRSDSRLTPRAQRVAVVFLSVCVVGLIGADQADPIASSYGVEKGIALALVVLPLVLSCGALKAADVRLMLATMCGCTSLLALLALAGSDGARTTALGVGPIVFAQLCGFSLIVLIFGSGYLSSNAPLERLLLRLRPLLVLLLIVALLRSQARGPAISLILVLSFALWSARNRQRSGRSLAIGFVVLVALAGSVLRLLSEAGSRFALLSDPLPEIGRSRGVPWGLGWGLAEDFEILGHGFGALANLDNQMLYPHNFALELVSEAGLFGFILLLVVVGAIAECARRRSALPLALVLFAFATTMTSGDLYNHRYLLAFACLPILSSERPTRRVAKGPAPRPSKARNEAAHVVVL